MSTTGTYAGRHQNPAPYPERNANSINRNANHANKSTNSTRYALLSVLLIFIFSLLALFYVYMSFPELEE